MWSELNASVLVAAGARQAELLHNATSTAVTYPRAATLLAAVCAIVFIVVGVIGNSVTAAALLLSPRLRAHPTTTFVLSLCMSDLLFCTVNLPLTAVRFLHERWTLGDTLCRLFPFFFYGNEAVSLLSMVAITLNRYVLIAYYDRYACIYTPRCIWLQLAAIWILAFGLMIPPAAGWWGVLGLDARTFSCTILRDSAGHSPKKFLFAVGFALPCLVIIGSYTCIYCTVRSSKKKLEARRLPLNGPSSKEREEDSRLTRLMLSIFLCFLACFLPLCVMNLSDDYVRYPWLHVVASILAWASSVLNPLIYAVTNRQYRAAYRYLATVLRTGSRAPPRSTWGSRTPPHPPPPSDLSKHIDKPTQL